MHRFYTIQSFSKFHRSVSLLATLVVALLLFVNWPAFPEFIQALMLLVGWQEGHPACRKYWGMVEVGTG